MASGRGVEITPIIAPSRWPIELHRLISIQTDDDWEGVLERIRIHPEEVNRVGPLYGQSALHVSCLRFPPLHVVEALLENSSQEIVLHQNNKGETPLHAACTSASEDVQLAVLTAKPDAVTLSDNYGDTPLHVAAQSGLTRVLREMVRVHPETIAAKNKIAETPFSLLNASYQEATNMEQVEDEDQEICGDWQNAILFLRAGMEESNTVPHCAAQKPCCPRDLLTTVLRLYSSETGVVYNVHGKTPLLLAASADLWDHEVPADDDGQHEDPIGASYPSVLQLFTQWNRAAASHADRDGRLPLTHALKMSKPWCGGIQHLVEAEPRALRTRDPESRFYPFQLAALYSDITTVYNLLRQFPEAISSSSDSSKPQPKEPDPKRRKHYHLQEIKKSSKRSYA